MTGNSRKVYTAFAETSDGSKVCPTLRFVTTFPHMQRAFFSRVGILFCQENVPSTFHCQLRFGLPEGLGLMDVDDPSNYRGICISSCLGKVFCSILNTRLLNFSNNHKILHRSQIGFVPGPRTSEHIFSLRTLIDQHVTHSPRGKLYTCFVDFKKAFDSIWHQGLLYKLLKTQVAPFTKQFPACIQIQYVV